MTLVASSAVEISSLGWRRTCRLRVPEIPLSEPNMPRLPADLSRRGTLGTEVAERDFPRAIRREQMTQLKQFANVMAMSRKFGPGKPQKTYVPHEPRSATERFWTGLAKR